MTISTDFLVSRTDLAKTKFVETSLDLHQNQALIKIDSFALTANNITYGAFGDAMMYWNFFPAPASWGRIPVWGFGDIIESKCGGVAPGTRVYGYFPMSSHLIVDPARVTNSGFSDAASHRQAMSIFYNYYQRADNDPAYLKAREAEQALFRPLFMTSFFIDDFLARNDFFGAREVVISSASSKTSLALAFMLQSLRRGQISVVGLTSPSNVPFVEKSKYYDRIVTYDAITQSARDKPAVFVDMAGNADVRAGVHKHWNDQLKYSCAVGATHWQKMSFGAELPGPAPILFFAPDHIKKRSDEWGSAGVEQRTSAAWRKFLATIDHWLTIKRFRGREEVERIYRDTLTGKASPECGFMLSIEK